MTRIDRNTFRKAIIEALAIAVGVFLALLADNWNENRKDREIAEQFLDGIVLDLTLNNERIEDLKFVASNLMGALERVIHAVETGENTWDSSESFARDLVQCTYLGTPSLSSIAFDELQSTGSMRLIEDVEIRRHLAKYYEDFRRQSQFHAEYRRKEAAIEEALLGFLPLSERIQVSDNIIVDQSDIDIGETIAALQRVPQLIYRLEDMMWVQHRIMTRYDDQVEYGSILLAQIEGLKRDK